MARKKTDAGSAVRARVLTDCQLGNTNDVVELTAELAEQFYALGIVDTDPDAVVYAAGLA